MTSLIVSVTISWHTVLELYLAYIGDLASIRTSKLDTLASIRDPACFC